MSRSDATTPLWVRATWYKPVHYCSTYGGQIWSVGGKCDLPPEPLRIHPRARSKNSRCEWIPVEDNKWRANWYYWSVPRWYTRHAWRDPQRVLVRDQLVQARQEYNGSGDVDVIPSTDQHRHGAAWLYW